MNASSEQRPGTLEHGSLTLISSAAIGRCWQSRASQQQRLLLDPTPCSRSLILWLGKPRSLARHSLYFSIGAALTLTNLNPFLEVVLALAGCYSF
jgi:hypothetical protein